MQPDYDLAAWRKQIPLVETCNPMNNCSQAPQSHATRRAAEEYLDSWGGIGMAWDVWMEEVEKARAAFARLIGASADEIAVSTSVSQATASVASAMDFAARPGVVMSGGEFPSVAHVWRAHQKYGAEIRVTPVRDGVLAVDDYAPLLGKDTAVVSACHGYYQTGFTQDIGAITQLAHEAGAMIYVDAYQTLGALSIDVKAWDVDFLASGNLKFLMGIPGIAFLYVHPRVLPGLEPAVTGWLGRENPFAFDADKLDWSTTARRFDLGTPPVLDAYVARAGMEMLLEVGPAAIEAWNRVLSARLVEGGLSRGLDLMGSHDPQQKAPTTAFRVADAHRVEANLRQRQVIASARGEALRLAPHFYSRLDDCDHALDTLVEVLAR